MQAKYCFSERGKNIGIQAHIYLASAARLWYDRDKTTQAENMDTQEAGMEITYRQIDRSYFSRYDQIPMHVAVESEYRVERPEGGLGGLLLREVPVAPYVKDLSGYEIACEYDREFGLTNWAFFMAFDGETPVGAVTLASRTKNIVMLGGREDLCVLWDIRVHDDYKRMGIGRRLFALGADWAREQGLRQMKIECQNNNVPACKFYRKQGAVLGGIDTYAYYLDPEIRGEVQMIWYLDL